MFEWLASLLVLLLHGNTARAVANQPNQHLDSGTLHTMDSTNPDGGGVTTDGSTEP
jgi:hypothetical protein